MAIYRNVKRVELDAEDKARGMTGDTITGEQSHDGGKTWGRFSAWLPLERITMAIESDEIAAYDIWSMSDYGVMDYDWSAIRDSSIETILAMEEYAKRSVPDKALFSRLGLKK